MKTRLPTPIHSACHDFSCSLLLHFGLGSECLAYKLSVLSWKFPVASGQAGLKASPVLARRTEPLWSLRTASDRSRSLCLNLRKLLEGAALDVSESPILAALKGQIN